MPIKNRNKPAAKPDLKTAKPELKATRAQIKALGEKLTHKLDHLAQELVKLNSRIDHMEQSLCQEMRENTNRILSAIENLAQKWEGSGRRAILHGDMPENPEHPDPKDDRWH